MENRDPVNPDPLRDEKNADLGPGLVSFHMLQQMWEESREQTSQTSDDTHSSSPIAPSVLDSEGPQTKRLGWRFFWIAFLILFVVLVLILEL